MHLPAATVFASPSVEEAPRRGASGGMSSWGGGRECTGVMHGRSRMTIADPRIPTIPGGVQVLLLGAEDGAGKARTVRGFDPRVIQV